MNLEPGGLLAWVIVGVIAGWLTGRIMRGRGYGCVTDLVIGLLGALVGGFVVGFFIKGTAGFFGSILVATLGAVLLVAIVRGLSGGRTAI
jgi:uncharacterized membrane protein YeaQ/YmgE (transglycosylase-associated protein family)